MDEAYKSMHYNKKKKQKKTTKNNIGEDWIVLDLIIRYSSKTFEC